MGQPSWAQSRVEEGVSGGANGRHPARLVFVMGAVNGLALSYWELGSIHTYLEVVCISTNMESLGLKNDWLGTDLTGRGQEGMWLKCG